MSYHKAEGSYKEILKEAVNGYPFGTPSYEVDGSSSYNDDVKKLYEEKENCILIRIDFI